VARNESGIRKILGGGTKPVSKSFNERADGPGERRHRTLNTGDLPSGAYSVDVTILDAHDRRRTRRISFELRAPG
jgi:hypothetical protein